ncbi:MAG: hypothetical protein JW795_14290 [Chitinivibrionales bacterium]|nr:hypothetical protein [Chitinivibrionales bacterium]
MLWLFFLSCTPGTHHAPADIPAVSFAVFNVGQGLSQIAVSQNRALVWDMGDSTQFTAWLDGYRSVGSPFIEALFISHGDSDHYGGVRQLCASSTVAFSGSIYTTPYVDTTALRAFAQSQKVSLHLMRQDDTLNVLRDMRIICFWPPETVQAQHICEGENGKNRSSFCMKIVHKNASVLITSDIDTLVQTLLCQRYAFDLTADIVVIPHHGSAASWSVPFYGYASPSSAVVSCGTANPFGHPCEKLLQFICSTVGGQLFDTRFQGHCRAVSNGYYWQWLR